MVRKILYALLILLLIVALWLWWNHPSRVEMATYAPADALLYLEANDLPDLARAIASTDAWQTLAPLAGINQPAIDLGAGSFNRYTLGAKWLAWTGVGAAEAIVLSRAQAALVVMDFDTAEEDAGKSLKIKPRAALVLESHTSEWRLRPAIEKLVGAAASRAYGEVHFEELKASGKDQTPLLAWTATGAGGNQTNARRIITAIEGSVAIIGNDETTVRACLAVRRNERPSLGNDKNLSAMRERVETSDSLAFAYISAAGAAKIIELAAIAYAGRAVNDSRAQGLVATLVPQLANRFVSGGAWSGRVVDGLVEDDYFVATPNGIGARLNQALASDKVNSTNFAALLPAATHQLTIYNARNPENAWRGFQTAIVSQLDVMTAAVVAKLQLFDALLKPYGIDAPRDFLRAVRSPVITARLDAASAAPLLIASVSDRNALEAQIRKRLGANPRVERISDTEMLASREGEEDEAASFVGDYLIFGAADDVRRCLQARSENNTLADSSAFKSAMSEIAHVNQTINILTLADDREAACEAVSLFGRRAVTVARVERESPQKERFDSHAYAMSETEISDDGIERRTRSYFGLFGALAAQFAPHRE